MKDENGGNWTESRKKSNVKLKKKKGTERMGKKISKKIKCRIVK